ncbi:RNA polymerase sigma factor SigX [Bacillus carboniphilus]|uniref:RNA polymerase sigma factor n=1 Tax=Bacillus carboniphilus TaxID=86663 RepID=A0ABY9JWK5_9BACI|nr:RNA polymerase sigma factor SigX [Bacillus carboniphilus]WLR43776.1 RNA polymerase sigma factor SigX [Bacillus carboniphilus]
MEEAFQELYDQYHKEIYQFLMYMVKKPDVVDDLVQEVYIKVLKSYEKFEGRSSQKTWLFSIARNVAMDYFRQQKTWKQRLMNKLDIDALSISDSKPLPEEIVVQSESVKLIYEALDCCNENQRAVVILRYIQQLSIVETAQVLKWSQSKVKTTQHRALKKLKDQMSELAIEKEGKINEKITLE